MAETALREPERLRPSMSPIAAPRAAPADQHALVSILAHDWVAALPGAGAPPAPAGAGSPERIVLTDLASRLVSILSGTPFEPDAASLAGRALVAADFTGADVLGHILRVLALRLPTLIRALPGIAAPDVARRLAVVTGALRTATSVRCRYALSPSRKPSSARRWTPSASCPGRCCTRRRTTRSPGSRIAWKRSAGSSRRWPPRVPAPAWACAMWTSTGSRRSTTGTATERATSCSSRSPGASAGSPVLTARSPPASAVTSSSCWPSTRRGCRR